MLAFSSKQPVMNPEDNNQAVAEDTTNYGEEGESMEDVVTLNKAEYDKMLQDMGSLKREVKTLKKPKDTESTSEKTKDNSGLSEKVELLSMQVAGLTKSSEKDLAKKLQKETGLPMDTLLESKYFKSELEDLRTAESNAEATTGIKGDKSGSPGGKSSAEYWIAKGEYPTHEQVPDRAVRKTIRAALVAKTKGPTSGNFYNS